MGLYSGVARNIKPWLGPFKVIKKLSDVTYYILNKEFEQEKELHGGLDQEEASSVNPI